MYDVLIVDDEPLVRVALRSLIPWEQSGFRCELEAGNGEQALEIFAERPEIALVFLDISMPVMNGLEFLAKLRLEGRDPEIIVLSAHGEYALVREAFKLGIQDYLLKTDMDSDHIMKILRQVTERIERKARDRTVPETLAREEMRIIRREALRNLFLPDGSHDVSIQQELLRLRKGCRVRVAVLWVEDFPSVAARYGGESLSTFTTSLTNTVLQVFSSRSPGEIVRMNDDEYVLVLSFEAGRDDSIDALTEDTVTEIQKTLLHYLNIHVTIRYGRTGDPDTPLFDLYGEARRFRMLASRIVVKARKYILENYTNPDLSLPEIAAVLDVSKNHLSFQFSRETGMTFKEYLMEIRVEAAKKLLLTTNLKVYETSEKVGYRNVEHFCRIFKRLTGRSPNSFSREAQLR